MTLTETYRALLTEFDIAQGGEMVYRFCDKGHNHSYLDFYEKYFEPHRAHTSILEIGVMTGGSLLLWQRWFDSVRATGIDLREGYNETFAWQSEIEAICHWGVDSTAAEPAVELDVYQFIIDDGDHTLSGQWATFKNFWDLVRPGGTYFIEDIESAANTAELRTRIETFMGDTVSIEHYRGHTREDDQILAITRKI
jgi:hypothetical protein